jgi:hypothetical protein
MKNTLLLLLLMPLCFAACVKKNSAPADDLPLGWCGTPPTPAIDSVNCDTVACTMEFREITVTIQTFSQQPVVLDQFYTTDVAGNRLSEQLCSASAVPGTYVIINDAWVNNHRNSLKTLKFVGYRQGQKIVDEVFTIATDCCHVSKAAGLSVITLRRP